MHTWYAHRNKLRAKLSSVGGSFLTAITLSAFSHLSSFKDLHLLSLYRQQTKCVAAVCWPLSIGNVSSRFAMALNLSPSFIIILKAFFFLCTKKALAVSQPVRPYTGKKNDCAEPWWGCWRWYGWGWTIWALCTFLAFRSWSRSLQLWWMASDVQSRIRTSVSGRRTTMTSAPGSAAVMAYMMFLVSASSCLECKSGQSDTEVHVITTTSYSFALLTNMCGSEASSSLFSMR